MYVWINNPKITPLYQREVIKGEKIYLWKCDISLCDCLNFADMNLILFVIADFNKYNFTLLFFWLQDNCDLLSAERLPFLLNYKSRISDLAGNEHDFCDALTVWAFFNLYVVIYADLPRPFLFYIVKQTVRGRCLSPI